MDHNRTLIVRQSHFRTKCDYRTLLVMVPEDILAGLKRLGVTQDEIANVIGRDRTAVTKMYNGSRSMKATEIGPLSDLLAKAERERGELGDRPIPDLDYLPVEVLPTYAGMGGGGSGDGDRRVALMPRQLVQDELRGRPSDFLMIDVRGNSMEPIFRHGDQILIDKRDRNPVQPGPFALLYDDGYVVKNVERRNGVYRVFSSNRDYSEEEIDPTDGRLEIMGRPVWFARRL